METISVVVDNFGSYRQFRPAYVQLVWKVLAYSPLSVCQSFKSQSSKNLNQEENFPSCILLELDTPLAHIINIRKFNHIFTLSTITF